MFPYIIIFIILIASSPFSSLPVEQVNNNCFLFGPRVVALGFTFWSHFVLLLSGTLDHHHHHQQDTHLRRSKTTRRIADLGWGHARQGRGEREKGPFGEGRQEEEEQKRLDAL